MSDDPFDINHFCFRVLRDSVNEATRTYWRRRADAFEAALPRVDDFPGAASPSNVAARVTRLRAIADACRNRATVCELTDEEQRLALDVFDTALAVSR